MKILNLITSFAFLMTILGCASGSHIITGKVRPAINKNEVTLYLEAPKKYEVIGIVEAIMLPFFKTSKTSFLIPPLYDTSGNSFAPLGSKLFSA